jgi:glycosyltransferase involved in cell wall biosynthesis
MNRQSPLLSVVVIGRNEGVRLVRCLQSVRNLEFDGEIELIYVDSGSTDDSVNVAKSFEAMVACIASRPCAAKARNAGWRIASGEFVVFLDGDVIVDRNFVIRSMPYFDAPEIAIVWGHRREINPGQSIYTGVLDLDWIWPAGDSPYCGGDALVRRSALVETDGFDDELIAGEEPELCRRLRARRYRILHVDVPMTKHDLAVTRWSQYWSRSVRTGHAYAEISTRFKQSTDPLWLRESRRNFTQGIFYLVVLPITGCFAVIFHSVLPVVAVLLAAILLVVRTAARKKATGAPVGMLIAYGIHAHLQQIPILVGQAGYWWSCLAGKRRLLIEYREDLS